MGKKHFFKTIDSFDSFEVISIMISINDRYRMISISQPVPTLPHTSLKYLLYLYTFRGRGDDLVQVDADDLCQVE